MGDLRAPLCRKFLSPRFAPRLSCLFCNSYSFFPRERVGAGRAAFQPTKSPKRHGRGVLAFLLHRLILSGQDMHVKLGSEYYCLA